MPVENPDFRSTWIIGYGNPHRKDDGIGPYVVDRLSACLGEGPGISLRSLEQGLRWIRVRPKQDLSVRDTHHLRPEGLAGLLESLYQCSPAVWLVSVQGNDFGFGEGLSLEAQEKAQRASSEIVEFCRRESIDKRQGSINDGAGASS
jgi:Ni,Fe-hydrogenase maturation factor